MNPRNGTWIVRARPQPDAHIRMLCFPYAGGGATAFSSWGQHLPPSIEVCAIQLPGRETRLREPLFTQLPPLVTALSTALAPLYDRPIVLFGYSMGAIIAFELARLLQQRADVRLLHLFAAARIAPQVRDPHPPIHLLPKEAFIQKLRDLNGTPEIIFQDLELQRMVVPILRADFAVNESYEYVPGQPLDIPITALGGSHDPKVGHEDLAQWASQTRAGFRMEIFTGDHFFINTAQAALLDAVLADLQPYS